MLEVSVVCGELCLAQMMSSTMEVAGIDPLNPIFEYRAEDLCRHKENP